VRLWQIVDELLDNFNLLVQKMFELKKKNEFKFDHWVDKIQTSSAVKQASNDYLFESLPYPTYGDGDIVVKTEILFNYFKNRYADFGRWRSC